MFTIKDTRAGGFLESIFRKEASYWRPTFYSCHFFDKDKTSIFPLADSGLSCDGNFVDASDEILDFLVEQIPAQSLANFRASDEARERIWTLIAREKETGLLPGEKVELDDYLKLEHLVVLAKASALLPKHG